MKNRKKIAAILIAIDIVLFIGAGYYIGGTFIDSLKNVKLEWLKKTYYGYGEFRSGRKS